MGSFTKIRRLILISLIIRHNIGRVGLKTLIRVGPHLVQESPIFIAGEICFPRSRREATNEQFMPSTLFPKSYSLLRNQRDSIITLSLHLPVCCLALHT